MKNHDDTQNAIATEEAPDLLGAALTIAENLRLLVLGPLVVGALVYGLTFVLPQRYVSTAIVRGDASIATLMTTAPILNASLKNLGYLKDLSEENAEDALRDLARDVQTNVGRNDKLITLVVAGRTAESAQHMANEILKNTFIESKPKAGELKRLEVEKTLLEQQAKELNATTKTVQGLLAEASPAVNLGALAESMPVISSNLIKIQEDLHVIDEKLQGVTEGDLLQAPTLPRRAVAPKKVTVTILATLGAVFALLMFVFVRQAFENSAALTRHQDRLSALKRKFGLGG